MSSSFPKVWRRFAFSSILLCSTLWLVLKNSFSKCLHSGLPWKLVSLRNSPGGIKGTRMSLLNLVEKDVWSRGCGFRLTAHQELDLRNLFFRLAVGVCWTKIMLQDVADTVDCVQNKAGLLHLMLNVVSAEQCSDSYTDRFPSRIYTN